MAGLYSNLTVANLLRACLESGADEAWREFVARTRRMIGLVALRTARRYAEPSPALIEDLVQETYLKLCENHCRALRKFQPQNEDALFGYLKVITTNVTNDHFKGVFAQKRGADKAIPLADAADTVTDRSAGSQAMERGVLFREIDDLLAASASGGNDREVFWLHYQGGLSAGAIAQIPLMGATVKSIERKLLKLTMEIREALVGKGDSAPRPSPKAADCVVDSEGLEPGAK